MKNTKISLILALTTATCLVASGHAASAPRFERAVTLEFLGTYASNIFDDGGAEIVAHDPGNQRLFVINAGEVSVDVLDIQDPAHPTKVGSIDASAIGGSANSVAVSRGTSPWPSRPRSSRTRARSPSTAPTT